MTLMRRRRVGNTDLRLTELGFGTGAAGNLYRPVSDAVARDALETALTAGVGYFDTAPFYGFGLSERRIGDALRGRDDVLISSKVGRLLVSDRTVKGEALREGFASPMPFRAEFDYSYDGILRSHEASLHRLGLARIDLLLVHDIGRMAHGAAHPYYWEQLTRGGGFRALDQLRAGGAVGGVGLGVNETEVCLAAFEETKLDVVLLAGRYTLLEQVALDAFLPACLAHHVSVVIGGPYNSGILATGTRSDGPFYYNYDVAPPEIVARVAGMEAIADAHGVTLAAAALQFPLAHPAVASVVPGLANRDQVERTVTDMQAVIADAFWRELQAGGFIRADAPVPTGRSATLMPSDT